MFAAEGKEGERTFTLCLRGHHWGAGKVRGSWHMDVVGGCMQETRCLASEHMSLPAPEALDDEAEGEKAGRVHASAGTALA